MVFLRLGSLATWWMTPRPSPSREEKPALAIKALSAAEVEGFLAGHGLGLAKAAELNGYPGPKHVLELARQLDLNGNQTRRTQVVFDKMQATARTLGAEWVAREAALDSLLSRQAIMPPELAGRIDAIGSIKARLRFTHMAAHMEMMEILTREQVQIYQDLRGLDPGGNGAHHEHNQHAASAT